MHSRPVHNFFSVTTQYNYMTPESAATIFHVTDTLLATSYYTETLGFNVAFRYADLTGLEYGNVLIYLSGPGQDAKKTAGEGSVYIFCNEVDEYYRSILIKGALLSVELADRTYEMRDFSIKDRDGNTLTFGKSNK